MVAQSASVAASGRQTVWKCFAMASRISPPAPYTCHIPIPAPLASTYFSFFETLQNVVRPFFVDKPFDIGNILLPPKGHAPMQICQHVRSKCYHCAFQELEEKGHPTCFCYICFINSASHCALFVSGSTKPEIPGLPLRWNLANAHPKNPPSAKR